MQTSSEKIKKDIKSMILSELEEHFKSAGEKAFRAEQVFGWLRGGVKSFEEMTNLSRELRNKLGDEFYIAVPDIIKKQVSRFDGTIKYLWQLEDGNAVESVVMSYEHGNTVCISTQVGCRMGCAFCASTLGGLVRNLNASEMENQVFYSQYDSGKKISNIVLMGIGEPLDNFENVMRFLELINNPAGMNIGMRHISLSTCGITENIDKLGEYNLQLTLSVSLHAPDDETRLRLMPINRSANVDELLRVCAEYYRRTGRRISFEYALIDGVNDTKKQARQLAEKLRGTGSHLNLILLNNVAERALKASRPEQVKDFTKVLEEKGVNYTVRRRLGEDVDAACGQLRSKHGNAK